MNMAERSQLAGSLFESQLRFKELAKGLHEVFWLMDWRTGHITSVSEAFEAIWGESADDLYGNPAKWTESIHADDRRCVEESFLKDAPLGKFAAQYRIVRPDNSIRWIRNRGFPIRTASGEVRWVAGIAEDITESKQAIEALAHLQRKYELILNSAGEGIYGLDCNGRVTFANPAAVNMIGWTAEELIGESMHDVLHHTRADGTSYPEAECPIHAAFRDGSVHRVDAEVFWKKEGTCFPVSYTSTPIVENGGLVGAVITFRDVTEQQRSDQALRNALVEVQQLKRQLQAENAYLKEEIKLTKNFEHILGRSRTLRKTLHRVEQVAATDTTVMISGETGTGKELFARAIHHLSTRCERPLINVNCATLPATLIESELFGHEKGAFTGALARKIGRFELADKGTIFLDEVGDLPLDLQSKLLRVLQEGEFERLGNPKTIKVDARVLAATNRNLEQAVRDGEFRMDLYYRLNVFPLELPALRDRKGDIPLLARHFVSKFAQKLGRTIDFVPENAQEALQAYDWPGNVRELENVIERAVILSAGNTLLINEALSARGDREAIDGATDALEQVEREHICHVLDDCHWVVSGSHGAAVRLGLNPSTLRSRMRKLGIGRSSTPAHQR